ncbi:RNA polymerase sigma factor [Leptospira vanthielii]|uniref:Sigma-70 region 2 n=1 Tax=Leptospira vanthielii serovar Holland str. Waz Holland = ATCC 700522 TaxID=1218591 RepID=N1VW74_9LEPT|nr:sigma-70 family RNA polymerase sigma factor [Leptospira vanthielii]EMY68224.1 sigma-70 region 2 [Leptospira vanthielii serovar Holland str. Waz Holland = ATCC 700522]
MADLDLLPHLFRTEYSKIVSVLCKRYGFYQIEIAEDIASETFLTASQTWGFNGIPENPVAWLYAVARNKAKNLIHRESIFQNKILPAYQREIIIFEPELDLSEENIRDSQLRMIFAISHPSIPLESQIGLSLRILCGFGIEEIARAFFTNKETINKRLFRAKEKLREKNVSLEFPNSLELEERFSSVLGTIYLLFNEGYHSQTQDRILRKDFCLEAIRLCSILLENKDTNTSEVNALLSLLCFHISRFEARLDGEGEIILYGDQDRTLWNLDFIKKGEYFFFQSSKEPRFSKYHLEAAIAYWHTRTEKTEKIWETISQLYTGLLELEPSPQLLLNRAYALFKAKGRDAALKELEGLGLKTNPYYFFLLGELHSKLEPEKAEIYYNKALDFAKTELDKSAILRRMV